MNELFLLIVVAAILSVWVLFTVIMITLADLRTIALERTLRRHPHARKWRGVTKLRKQLILHGDESNLSRVAVRQALARFQADPSTRFVEILPRIAFPQTTRQFFAAYHMFALAPFVRLRATLNVRHRERMWPALEQPGIAKNRREQYYGFGLWLLSVAHIAAVAYIGFIAALGEPTYLVSYLAVFVFWLVWSVCSYPAVPAWQKTAYLLLAPASFGYFLWRIVAMPVSPLRLVRLLVSRRRPVLS